MKRTTRGISVFFIALLISFIILSCIFLLVLIFSKTENAVTEQDNLPYLSEYVAQADESLGVLLIGCEQPQSLPDFITLVYYDAPEGIIYPITLPGVAVSTAYERRDTLQGHYDYSGAHGCMSGVKALFDIELDRYARFQKQGIANMVDLLGGIPYDLQVQKDIGGEQLLQGEQLLDGRRVSSLIFAKTQMSSLDTIGITDTAFQSEMLTTLIEDSFNSEFVTRYDGFVSSFFLNCETNLNSYDFSKRQTGFLNRLRLDSLVTKEIIITGDYNSDFTEFYISDESIVEVKGIFAG